MLNDKASLTAKQVQLITNEAEFNLEENNLDVVQFDYYITAVLTTLTIAGYDDIDLDIIATNLTKLQVKHFY